MFGRILAVLVLAAAVIGIWLYITQPATPAQDTLLSAHNVVTRFGSMLQQVSLLGPESDVSAAMDANYARYVSPQLIAKWKADPATAPGRLTSSPWPDRIEIATTTKESDTRYRVDGAIVEVTNEGGGIGVSPTEAARLPITLVVENTGGEWLISQVVLGASPARAQWQYSQANAQGLQAMYPTTLGTHYISTSTEGWPPQVSLAKGALQCATSEQRTIGDRTYCIARESEGAAGSTYATFTYSTAQGDAVASTSFTLRLPQCMNYDDPQQTACKTEQATYDIDGLADRIISSIRTVQ